MWCLLSGRRVSYPRVFNHIEARSFKIEGSCRRHRLSPTMASFSDLFYGIGFIFYSMFCYSSQRSCHGNITAGNSLGNMRTKKYGAQPIASTAFASAAAMKLCFYYYNIFIHLFSIPQRQSRYLRSVRRHETDVNFNYIRYRCRFGTRQGQYRFVLIL
jgi:hypothetical protein